MNERHTPIYGADTIRAPLGVQTMLEDEPGARASQVYRDFKTLAETGDGPRRTRLMRTAAGVISCDLPKQRTRSVALVAFPNASARLIATLANCRTRLSNRTLSG